MNHHNAVVPVYQQSKVQSKELRSFTLIDIYGGEFVIIADSQPSLLSSLVSQREFSCLVGLELLVSRLWSGQTCVLSVLELVLVPGVHSVSRLELDYIYPETTSSLCTLVGVSNESL